MLVGHSAGPDKKISTGADSEALNRKFIPAVEVDSILEESIPEESRLTLADVEDIAEAVVVGSIGLSLAVEGTAADYSNCLPSRSVSEQRAFATALDEIAPLTVFMFLDQSEA